MMNINRTDRDRRARVAQQAGERGTALMFALMVLFILSIGTSVLWKQLHGHLAQQRRAWHQEQAYQLAEAGLENAVARLMNTSGAYTGESDITLGPGTWSVTVTPGANNEYVLESWGKIDNAAYQSDRAGLRGRVRLSGNRVVEYSWEPIQGNAP